jgi:hypothetical protein
MNKFKTFASDMFNKIRGRFTDVTIGDENGNVTNIPEDARFFEFSYNAQGNELGKVSVSLDEENGVTVIVAKDLVLNQVEAIQDDWYNFLKELRYFAKKRMLKFDVRDINKSNLDKRDYEYLAQNRPGENTMSESKMYGNETRSYQKIGKARIAIKHSAPINVESSNSRTSKIGSIYIESPTGERFKYPYKHLAGARAMALHVNEGGHMYDDFGKYISGLSEEMSKLRKFSQYMNRSSVMAETLEGYTDIVKGRIKEVRQEIQNLQKPGYYKEASENYEVAVMEEVPTNVSDAWVDQLTIKQFNEELKDVFPYIYNLVGTSVVETIDLDDILDEGYMKGYKEYHCKDCGCQMHNCKPGCDCSHDSHDETGSWWRDADGNGVPDAFESTNKVDYNRIVELAIDKLMGQFAEEVNEAKAKPGYCSDDCCGADVKAEDCTCAPTCEHCDCNKDKKESDDDTMDVKVGPQGMEPMDQPQQPELPIGEFILSYFDRENGTFPKGETAVLTMVEKQYGEQYVEPAAKFMKKVETTIAHKKAEETANSRYPETELAKQGEIGERSQFELYRNSIVLYDPTTMEVKRTYPLGHGKRASADAEKLDLIATDGAKYMELVRDKKRMAAQDTEKSAELPKAQEPKKPGALDRLKSLAGLS